MPDDSQRPLGGTETQDPAFYRALGRAIRVLRNERDLGRKDLAERSGVSYPYLSEIESGKKRPSSQALLAIAQALGLRLHELLAAAERPPRGDEPPEVEPYAMPAACDAPLAYAPAESQASPARRSRFFHERSEAAAFERVQPAAAAPQPDAGSRTKHSLGTALAELRWLLPRMAAEDIERLLDLARRLSR